MQVSIKKSNKTIKVTSQYNPLFSSKARKLNGQYDYSSKSWSFDIRVENLVKEILLEVYGNDGSETTFVDVDITVGDDNLLGHQDSIYLAGRIIAGARGRDSGATIGNGIVLVSGEIKSGGSVKNWLTVVKSESVFRILDLPLGALKFLEDREDINYKIIDTHNIEAETVVNNDSDVEQLKAEINNLQQQALSIIKQLENLTAKLVELAK